MQRQKTENFIMLDKLLSLPILYRLSLFHLTNSIKAALMLGQCIYWQYIMGEGELWYKEKDSWKKETGLTISEQDKARSILIEKGLIEYQLKGIPRKGHYRVDFKKLAMLLPGYDAYIEKNTAITDNDKTTPREQVIPASITESTPETQETTHNNINNFEYPDVVVQVYNKIKQTQTVRNPEGLLYTLMDKYSKGQLVIHDEPEIDNEPKISEALLQASSQINFCKDMIDLAKTEEEKEAFREQLSLAEEQYQSLKNSTSDVKAV